MKHNLIKHQNSTARLLSAIGTVESPKQALVLYRQFGMNKSFMAQRTRVEYENDLSDLISFLAASGVTQLKQVGLAHLRIYQAGLERRGYKPSTCNRKTFAIKGFFTFLYDYALIKDDFAKGLIPPVVERREPRFLSEAEYTRLLAMCIDSPRDTAIIQLFLQTGIRLSELVNLSVNDVILFTGSRQAGSLVSSIRIQRNKRRVSIPLNYRAQDALRKWLEIREPVLDTALFLTALKKPMGKRAVQLMLVKYMAAANIDQASVQTLRHTMAVHHLVKGTDPKTLANILGDDMKTMQMYMVLARKVNQKALQEHFL